MGILNVFVAEGAYSKLDHGAVVHDLGGGVTVMDYLLKMGHQYEVTGLKPVVVHGVMVNVAEDGAGSETVGCVLGVHVAGKALNVVHTCFTLVFALNKNKNS